MAAKSIKMEQLKQVLRLHQQGYAIKRIVRDTGISKTTIKKYLRSEHIQTDHNVDGSIKKINPEALQDDTTSYLGNRYGRLIDYFKELEKSPKNIGVTRQLLWLEYKESNPDGYNYSQYCYHFNEYTRHKEVVMHLDHDPGAQVMIDFAGKKLSYVDPNTGELINCQVFIGVLPCSGLMFCKAVHTQNTYDFNDCINAMLKYFGGSPKTILCDNLRTAVSRPNRYEPVFTELCYQLGDHYRACFSAARPYKPRDKAMVERCVQIAYNNIYAPMRHDTCFSIEELNAAILEKLEKLNSKKYKGSPYSRKELYQEREEPYMIALPVESFKLKKVTIATVQRNYHVQLSENHHYYSVPYTHAGKKVKILYDQQMIEIYYEGERIAVHQRNNLSKAYHTIQEHMPSNHRHALQVRGWKQEDLLKQASNMGLHVLQVAEHILASSFYPEQNYKSCYGLIMLKNKYDRSRIDNACKRALQGTRIRYGTICDILKKGLDQQTDLFTVSPPLPDHENIRGPLQYQ